MLLVKPSERCVDADRGAVVMSWSNRREVGVREESEKDVEENHERRATIGFSS